MSAERTEAKNHHAPREGTDHSIRVHKPRPKEDAHAFPFMLEGPNAPLSIRFANIYRGSDQVKGQESFPSPMHWEDKPVVPEMAWAIRTSKSARRYQEAVNHRREIRLAMGQVLRAVGVKKPSEIRAALADPARRAEMKADLDRKITSQYSVYGPDEKAKETQRAKEVASYGVAANDFITGLRFGVLNPIAYKINPSNEVVASNDPIDLIGLMFDPDQTAKIRFEAKRKLFLMKMFAAVDYRSRELAEVDKFQAFQYFLNHHVLDKTKKAGETITTGLLSKQREDGYITTSVEEIPESQISKIRGDVLSHNPEVSGEHLRLTVLEQRLFRHEVQLFPAFIDPRPKTPDSTVEKLIRKGLEDPAVAVEDVMGMIVVLKDNDAIDNFLEHMQDAADESGSAISFEGLEDSIDTGLYSAQNTGSSTDTRMLKFFARVKGMRIEIIMHTYESYIDYMYSDTHGHKEYEIRRMFDTGVFDLLFPQSVYKSVKPREDEEQMLAERRMEKRNSRIA